MEPLLGLNRIDSDFELQGTRYDLGNSIVEREESEVLMVVSNSNNITHQQYQHNDTITSIVNELQNNSTWTGVAPQLSYSDHHRWQVIEQVSHLCEQQHNEKETPQQLQQQQQVKPQESKTLPPTQQLLYHDNKSNSNSEEEEDNNNDYSMQGIIRRRRSGAEYDGETQITKEGFLSMLSKLLPENYPQCTLTLIGFC